MADAPNPKPRGGCFARLFAFLLFLIFLGFGLGVYAVYQPQKLSDLEGYGATPEEIANERDVSEILKLAVERGFPVTLTEGQLNRWLAQRLDAKQGGLLAGNADIKRVWIRLEQGRAEIITEREIFGHPLTLSLYLGVAEVETAKGKAKELQLHGGPFITEEQRLLKGGRFGKLVVPQGFLVLVLPEYQKLAATLATELDLGGNEMSRIEFKKGKIELSPLAPNDDASGIPGMFH